MRAQLTRRTLFATVCFALLAATSVAGAANGLVTASVARGQTVSALRYQLFTQQLKCTAWCDATTVVTISIADARRLGFSGPEPANGRVMVASNFIRIKPNATTTTRFVVTKLGKHLLAKARRGLHVSGDITAFPRGKPRLVSTTHWATVLR